MYITTSQQVRLLDQKTIASGISSQELMERAGKGAAQIIQGKFPKASFLILVGKGNNGGDGLVVAHELAQAGFQVTLFDPLKSQKSIERHLSSKVVIIDALFGIGLTRHLEEPYVSLIRKINLSKYCVVSLDIPSGMNADTGQPMPVCFRANLTITFGAVKWGILHETAHEWVGQIETVDIGYTREVTDSLKSQDVWVERSLIQSWVKPRLLNSHKGTHGHLLVVGGSSKKPGAIMLTGYAALRNGSGLVSVALPDRAFQKFPKNFLELMFEPLPSQKDGEFGKISQLVLKKIFEKKTALAIGPGMGTSKSSHEFLKNIIRNCDQPSVMDADALNILSADSKLLKKLSGKPVILTPHPAEMARLMKVSVKSILKNRVEITGEFAMKHRVFVLLKGYRSVMSTPSGQIYINSTGNAGMATAGMGDTLTGIIGSLLAQGYDTEKAMLMGAWVHGRAGDRVAERLGDRGMVAQDVIAETPLVYKELR